MKRRMDFRHRLQEWGAVCTIFSMLREQSRKHFVSLKSDDVFSQFSSQVSQIVSLHHTSIIINFHLTVRMDLSVNMYQHFTCLCLGDIGTRRRSHHPGG